MVGNTGNNLAISSEKLENVVPTRVILRVYVHLLNMINVNTYVYRQFMHLLIARSFKQVIKIDHVLGLNVGSLKKLG